jgi:molybdate transport system substrate-binding protein
MSCLAGEVACLARGHAVAGCQWSAAMRLFSSLIALPVVLGLFAAPALARDSASQSAAATGAKTLTVFAAASMKNALDEVNAAYQARSGVKITASYAASSALAKQIEQGAPADIFLSADLAWMDYLAGKDAIESSTRVSLLGNRIVLIVPKDSRQGNVSIGQGFDLAGLAGDGRIATGDVRAVPVGKYAKAALEKLGAWDKAAAKFAMAENVRAALALVSRGEAVLGIVYETDAKVDPGVRIIGAFPGDSHPPIVYPVAATTRDSPAAASYLAFLRSPDARAVFEKYGFSFLNEPAS